MLRFSAPGDVEAALAATGQVPLPPYIQRPLGPDQQDIERYQTVYARHPGSIAAPTAGLHFTQELLDDLMRREVELAHVTLHVGPGTFRPVRSEDVARHRLDGEQYHIPEATVRRVAAARSAGRRVIAVGTTATRALEAAATPDGSLLAGSGVAETVIRPGYEFRIIQGLLTNFHLPRSSLLLLVAALVGRQAILRYYQEALARQYRFYSYGDAMLIADQPGQITR
jgi:S-adenosylmethionine:tRNA ribosyltransferase-isomerase